MESIIKVDIGAGQEHAVLRILPHHRCVRGFLAQHPIRIPSEVDFHQLVEIVPFFGMNALGLEKILQDIESPEEIHHVPVARHHAL